MTSDRIDTLAQEMFDLLASNPNEIQRDDIVKAIGLSGTMDFHDVKGVLQDLLGEGDSINVVGRAAKQSGGEDPARGYFYRLEGDGNSPVSKQYQIQKARGLFTRQKRALSVSNSMVKDSDGRTAAGRALRAQNRNMRRTMEDTIDVLAVLGDPHPPDMPK